MALKGFQKKYLRGLAHRLRPVVLVGERGLTENVHKSVSAALLTHELIKVRLRRPEDKKADAAALAQTADAVLCGLIGHTAILYRRHPEEPQIRLPQPKAV